MANLLETYVSYVPARIARRAASDPSQFERPTTEVFDAAMLFADISGFTALTERLAVRGAAGAEDLTRLLNAYLGQLVGMVLGRGGEIAKFAGDAVLALWPAEEGTELADAIHRAAECALEIQAKLNDYPVAEDVSLSVKLGVGAGEIVFATLGGTRSRWEHLVTGPPIAQVAAANIQAQPGQTVLSPEAWELVGRKCEAAELRDGFMLLEELRQPAPAVSVEPVPVTEEAAPVLRSFIPAAIRARLDAGQSDWLAELRPLTILFVSLPDLSYHAEIEVAQDVMTTLQACLYKYEGSINKLSVDDKGASLIAVLGLPPLAHEDDPARGVRAAIDMRDTLEAKGLRCSTGITTGLAFCGVVGGERRREYTIMGDVVNLAARLMQAAMGGILCDEATADGAEGRLTFEPLAAMKVKGKKDPISVFRPIRPERPIQPDPGRSSDAKGEIVGRDAERGTLSERVEKLGDESASSRIVVEGEAGMGKSRLLDEALATARARGARVLVGAGDSIESSTPYYAWRRVFYDLLALDRLPEEAADRRRYVAEQMPEEVRYVAPLLDAVLPFEWPDNEHTAPLDGKARADATHDLLARLLEVAAARGPLVIAVEDAHWIDSGSWALLHLVAERVRPLLLLVASRQPGEPVPSDYARLLAAPGTEVIRLDRLPREATVEVARKKLGVTSLPAPVELIVAEKSDGNPFFAEELVYAIRDAGMFVVDGGVATLAPGAVKTLSLNFPNTIQGLITSRIDRLSPEQQLTIKVASVIGRAFSFRALRDIHPIPAVREQLLDHVENLRVLDLTPLERSAPDLEYVFKHVITQDVAYGLMSFEQRRTLHRAVAEWYERTYAADLEQLYPYLAYHWRKAAEDRTPDADLLRKSIDYYERAAGRAALAHVNEEAIDLYADALKQTEKLPESSGRDALELRLLLSIGALLIATRGYGSDEVRETYDRARELSTRTGDDELHFTALRGLWAFAIGRAEYETARDLGRRMLEIAARDGEPSKLLEAHRALGNTVFWLGDLEGARAHMERGIELYTPDRDHALAFQFGQDPDVANRGMQAWPLSLMGFSERALARGEEAIAHARELGHPYSIGYALVHDMCANQYLRRVGPVAERAAEALALASEKGFPNWLLAAMVLGGWASARTGDAEEGAARIGEAIALWRSAGSELVVPYFYGLQAEALLGAGRYDEGIETIATALEISRRNSDRWFVPELHRLEGDLRRLRGDDAGEVVAAYRRALDAAREVGARLLELRAAVSLGRVWRDAGRAAEARELVSGVYVTFSEGLDLPDLVEARGLLEMDATA